MTRTQPLASAGLALLLTACSPGSYFPLGASPPAAASALAATPWAAEAQAVRDAAALPHLVLAIVLLAALWLLGRLAHGVLRFGWRLGLDPKRRLASWFGLVQLAAAAVVLYVIVTRFLDVAPAFALWTLALTVGALVLVLGRPLQSMWAGQLLRLRLRLREGDRISVAGRSGVVRDIGLLRIEVLSEDGTLVFLPNRVVAQEVVAVEPGRGTASVRVRVPIEAGSFSDAGERLRRAAFLSPYRAPRTPVLVTPDDEAKSAWVEIQVWSLEAVRAAEAHLATALEAQAGAVEPAATKRAGDSESRGES